MTQEWREWLTLAGLTTLALAAMWAASRTHDVSRDFDEPDEVAWTAAEECERERQGEQGLTDLHLPDPPLTPPVADAHGRLHDPHTHRFVSKPGAKLRRKKTKVVVILPPSTPTES